MILLAITIVKYLNSNNMYKWDSTDDQDLLFRRIIQLIFIGTRKALLYPSVNPESFHARQKLFRKRLSVFHSRNDIHNHFGISLKTYLIEKIENVQ